MSAFAAHVAERFPRRDEAGEDHPGRRGAARLGFARGPDGATYLAEQRVGYPFHVTKPFHLEDDWPEFATLYLQSVSGGLFQGDRLTLICEAQAGAAVQITTQASTKVHSMEADFAVHTAKLKVREGAYLEYLADPMILFPQARLISRVTLELAEGAQAVLSDAFLFHDPAQADAENVLPAFDAFASEVEIAGPDGNLLAADRFLVEEPKRGHANPALAGGHLAQGAVYAVSLEAPPDELVRALRAALAEPDGVYAGVSRLPNGCGAIARVLAPDGASLRAALERLWAAARKALTGRGMARVRK